MSNFIDGYGNKTHGFPKINLDHVAYVRPVNKGAARAYDCYDSSGNDIGTVDPYDLTRATAILPNTSSAEIVGFWAENDEIKTYRLPIIAWNVESFGEYSYAEPVSIEALDGTYCVHFENPQLFAFTDGALCDDMATAAEHARVLLLAKAAKTAKSSA